MTKELPNITDQYREASPLGWRLVKITSEYAVVWPLDNRNGLSSVARSNGGQSIRLALLDQLVAAGLVVESAFVPEGGRK